MLCTALSAHSPIIRKQCEHAYTNSVLTSEFFIFAGEKESAGPFGFLIQSVPAVRECAILCYMCAPSLFQPMIFFRCVCVCLCVYVRVRIYIWLLLSTSTWFSDIKLRSLTCMVSYVTC